MLAPLRTLAARAAIAGGLALAASGCLPPLDDERGPALAETAQPLVGASLTDLDPAVVALTVPSGAIFCTGTLISPSVIATAAHCIDDGGSAEFSAFFGSDTQDGEGARVTVLEKQQHLDWNGNLSGGNDIGLLRLAFPADVTLPIPVNVEPLDSHLGETIRVVGFGINDPAEGTIDGKKRTGEQALASLSGDFFEAADDTVVLCNGDSGGPAFFSVGGVEALAGINSYTFGNCDVTRPSGYTNVSLFAEDFVIPWIEENDPACGEDGLCARLGCLDDPDCQPCGPDGTCVDDCALPDRDCPTSEVGEICQADTQCVSGLCVFWRDDLSTHFCSEPCELGSDTCPDGMSCQTVQPFGNVCYYDAPPPGVIGDACDEPTDCGSYLCLESRCVRECSIPDNKLCPADFTCASHDSGANFYCFANPDEGGCASGGGGSGSGSGVALVLLVCCLALRRTRRV
jgi:hypothetical protein